MSDLSTVKFRIERNKTKISIELRSGDNFAIFTAPASDFKDFQKSLKEAIDEADAYSDNVLRPPDE